MGEGEGARESNQRDGEEGATTDHGVTRQG